MKFVSEFRDKQAAKAIALQIRKLVPQKEIRIMEVCGGHTITIYKYGIKNLLPENIHLISGPGCPVCVTSNRFIDHAIALSRLPDTIITSFGDMIRVPGSHSSLFQEKSKGRDIRPCYSVMDALAIAKQNPQSQVVFLGIGFETTSPTVAVAIKNAKAQGISNFYVLSAFKTMPNALKALVDGKLININAFICPGHVSTITGLKVYEFLAEEYGLPCVVSGFEPLDMLQSIYMILKQIQEDQAKIENQYARSVTWEGNEIAQKLLDEVFTPCEMDWRGIGRIPESGLIPNAIYQDVDAGKMIPVTIEPSSGDNPACICGDIMLGVKTPVDCLLFKNVCNPESPKGACMVSAEGACATYLKYG
jgi:hydrogenase expression/formation protein HypD